MRIIFAGTPEFSVQALAAIVAAGHEVCAVYTQPDRPAGRGQKLTPSPVKQWAVEHGLPVLQPKSLKGADEQAELVALGADVMVVVAYGLLLPKAVLDAPRLGCVNIHASLLPRWRGAAPIQRAILAGDEVSGVTIMQMDVGLDTGPMLLIGECPIDDATTGGMLHDALAVIGSRLIVDVLPMLVAGTVKPVVQPEAGVTYASKLSKDEAVVDWNQSARMIVRRIHAFNSWPVAQTTWRGDVMRLWRAQLLGGASGKPVGTVVAVSKDGVDVQALGGVVRLLEVQMPGKRAMAVSDFLNANAIQVGEQLGGVG